MLKMDLTASEEEAPAPKFDFSHPEDVLIVVGRCEVTNPWGWGQAGMEIVETLILNPTDGIIGAASYEECYGGFLNYTLEDITDPPSEPGTYVVHGMTGTFTKGDGWTTDDDMDFECVGIRQATEEEKQLIG